MSKETGRMIKKYLKLVEEDILSYKAERKSVIKIFC